MLDGLTDAAMRRFEPYSDATIPPDLNIVVRVDGRAFHGLTASVEKPFDRQFHDWMVHVAQALIGDARGVYAATHSDEVSVLLPRDADAFARRAEKLATIMAGLASSSFTAVSGLSGVFDARIVALPSQERVADYFIWRQLDAARGCINSHAYWLLRREGMSERAATKALLNKPQAERHEMLHARGVNFAELPAWQRNDAALHYVTVPHSGQNPLTGETVATTRRRLVVVDDVPWGQAFRGWFEGILGAANAVGRV